MECAFLAPDTAEAIHDGRQPSDLNFEISGRKVDDFFRYNVTSAADVLGAMRQAEVLTAKALSAAKATKGKLIVQSAGRKRSNPHKHSTGA